MRFLLALVLFAATPAFSWQAPKDILDSVVLLEGLDGRGTGFHIKAPSGNVFLLTNKHICMLAKDGLLLAYKENFEIKTTKVLVVSQMTDLCLAESVGGEPLRFGSEPEYKDTVTIYGHPLGGPLALSIGGIQSRNNDEFVAGAKVQPGNSGSPVLNDSGRVVGIVFAYFPDTRDSIFVDVESIREFIQSM